MKKKHLIKYWIAKCLDYFNTGAKIAVGVGMILVTIPYLAVMSIGVLAFIGLFELGEMLERWLGLERANLAIEIERARSEEERSKLKSELDRISED